MRTWITADGDMLDDIALKVYGVRLGAATTLLMEANPTLADMPARLPAGVSINIPDLAPVAATTAPLTKLWD